jgi:hypothetical protein
VIQVVLLLLLRRYDFFVRFEVIVEAVIFQPVGIVRKNVKLFLIQIPKTSHTSWVEHKALRRLTIFDNPTSNQGQTQSIVSQ